MYIYIYNYIHVYIYIKPTMNVNKTHMRVLDVLVPFPFPSCCSASTFNGPGSLHLSGSSRVLLRGGMLTGSVKSWGLEETTIKTSRRQRSDGLKHVKTIVSFQIFEGSRWFFSNCHLQSHLVRRSRKGTCRWNSRNSDIRVSRSQAARAVQSLYQGDAWCKLKLWESWRYAYRAGGEPMLNYVEVCRTRLKCRSWNLSRQGKQYEQHPSFIATWHFGTLNT